MSDRSSASNYTSTATNNSTAQTSTTSSSECKPDTDEGLGPDQKIEGYVDFSDFYKNFEAAKRNGTLPQDLLDFMWLYCSFIIIVF